MSVASVRPWLESYPAGMPSSITTEHSSMQEVFATAVATSPDAVAISYFNGHISYRELDERSDALACALLAAGFEAGDRLAIYTQNDPAFVVGLLAAWKADGCAALINPMNRAREVSYLLRDSGASAVLCLDELYDVVRTVLESEQTSVRQVVLASAQADQTRDDLRVLSAAPAATVAPGAQWLADLISRHRGEKPPTWSATRTRLPC